MRRGIRWVCAMAAAGAIGGFAQQSQALTVAEAISANFVNPTTPIIFEDNDIGWRVEDTQTPGLIGDFVYSVVRLQEVASTAGFEVSSSTGNSIKQAPLNGNGTTLGADGNSELTVLTGGQIVNIIPTASGAIIVLAPIASTTWNLGAGGTFNVPMGISGGSVVALVYEDAVPDFVDTGDISDTVGSATDGTLIAAAGFTAALNPVGANAAGEFFINVELASDPDLIADQFELNLNFLDITGVAGSNQVLGPNTVLPNDLGPGTEGPFAANVPNSGFGDRNLYGQGAQLYAKGNLTADVRANSEFDVTSDGDFYVLIPTPAAVIPGLAVLGMLALRRPRREEA